VGASFSNKKEQLKNIDNLKLVEPMHEERMKEVIYNQEFVIIPKL